MTNLVVRKETHGGIEAVKLERVRVICPACGQQVEALSANRDIGNKIEVNMVVEPAVPISKLKLPPLIFSPGQNLISLDPTLAPSNLPWQIWLQASTPLRC